MRTLGRLTVASIALAALIASMTLPAQASPHLRPDVQSRLAEAAKSPGHDIPAPSIKDMLQRERTHTYNVNIGSGQRPEPKAVGTWRDECLAHDIDDFDTGWVRDRSHFCNHKKDLELITIKDDGELGILHFDWLVYGYGSTGGGSQRLITLFQELTNVHSDSDAPWPENTPVTVGARCKVETPQPAKADACSTPLPLTRSVAEWQSNPESIDVVYSQETSSQDQKQTGEGPENVVMAGFTPYVTNVAPALGRPLDSAAEVSFNAYARFDSAPYLSTHQGAVFRGVVPHLTYDTNEARVKEVAEHIRDACDPDKVNDTYPPASGGKSIPGCDIDHLIHRLAPTKVGWPAGNEQAHQLRYNANGREKDKNCNADTPATGSSGDKQCDEFPFASTYEGAAASKYPASEFAGGGKANQFSVRKVNAQQNGWAGSDLGTWYSDDRILDWAHGGSSSTSANGTMRDGFWVRITAAG